MDDFVKVTVIGDKTIVNQAKSTDVEFQAITAHSVGYYDSSKVFRNAELDRDLLIWKGNTYYLRGDLVQGAGITMHQIDNRVVGIRVK